jgi:serine protease Do
MHVRFHSFFLLLPLLAAPFPGTTLRFAAAQDKPVATAEAVQEAFVRVADRVKPMVVTVVCEKLPKAPAARKPGEKPGDKPNEKPAAPDDDEDEAPFGFSDPSEPSSSLGTGVVIRADGYILTNNHVIRGADVIRVLFNADGENPDRAVAQLVGSDEESDLAVLKISRKDLPTATFADSDAVRIGQWALAIGAPFDQPQTFTAGVISAKSRHLERNNEQSLQDYLQTDASINPGNSGGPLVNLEGEVIGINTAILSPSRFNVGIGFSVPSNTVKRLMPILLSGKSVQRGFLGIKYVRIDEGVAKEFGVAGGMQIGALAKNKEGAFIGPAKEAGLREDDIITAVDGQPMLSREQFRALVATTPPGATLKFSVTRPGADKATQFETSVILGDRETQGAPATPKPAVQTKAPLLGLGLDVANASSLSAVEKAKFGDLTGKEKGAVITKIAPGSPADEGSIPRGLRIVRARVGGVWQLVPDAATWQKIEKNAAPSERILLQLRDGADTSFYKLIVAPEKATATTLG